MPASSARKGRKLNRQPTNGTRTPACKSCQKRRVRCDGGDPCQSCIRKAAWDGVPPPVPGPGGGCEYEGGRAPCPRGASTAKPQKTRSGRRVEGVDGHDEDDDEERGGNEDDDEEGGSRSRSRKGKGRAKEGGGPGNGSKPLQKGLACLACKSRRVRCDGLKPSCTACRKMAEKHDGVECVYRADLYLQKQREEQEKREGRGSLKEEEEEAGEDEYMLPSPPQHQPSPPVKHEVPVQPLSLLNPDLLPPLPPLPSTAHTLPILPSIPEQQYALPSFPAYTEQPHFPAAVAPTDPCCAAPSSLCLSSIFPSLPYPYTTSTSAAAATSGIASQPSTAPPSPAYSISASSVASTYHPYATSSSAWSTSSASAFPSPRTPLEDWTFRLLRHGGQPTYPPVPYPAPSSMAKDDAAAVPAAVGGVGAAGSINPFWTTTNAIPPLMLGSDPEELSLSLSYPSSAAGGGGGFLPPSVTSSAAATPTTAPPTRPTPMMEIKRSPPRMFDDELLTLTLPMIPEFETRDWN